MSPTQPWKISLHGGHSGQFCDHAVGTLREVLEAALAAGFPIFGVSEHAPRTHARYLYDKELEMGWTVQHLHTLFEAYVPELFALADEFEERGLTVLRGFETEAIPEPSWIADMTAIRAAHGFDFIVGSVHHLHDYSIDGPPEYFQAAMEAAGGLEPLCVAYYDKVTEVIEALRPEVVAHLDLIRKNGHRFGDVDTPAAKAAARRALEAARAHGCILDLNAAGYRKGLPTPYPAPWLVAEALAMGVPFCFGDDSHGPGDVGRDLDRARAYLLEQGVTTITALDRRGDEVVKKVVPL